MTDAIWVMSDCTPDGTYTTAIHINDDTAVMLNPAQAAAYAQRAYRAATTAEHDAAVIRQLTTIGISTTDAAATVADLRADRPAEPAREDPVPLEFTPIVAQRNLTAYIHVHDQRGRQITQWTPGDLRGHAGHVLECAAAADLDAAYRQHLVGVIGLDDNRARQAVAGLADHRGQEEEQ